MVPEHVPEIVQLKAISKQTSHILLHHAIGSISDKRLWLAGLLELKVQIVAPIF